MQQFFIAIILVLGLGSWYLYNENQTLTANNFKLEGAVEEQKRTMVAMKESFEKQGQSLLNMTRKAAQAETEKAEYLSIFSRHNLDLGGLKHANVKYVFLEDQPPSFKQQIKSVPTILVLDKNKKHDIEVIIDRIVVSDDLGNRLADSVETALKVSGGLLWVEIVDLPEKAKAKGKYKVGETLIFSEKFSCPVSGFTISEIEPRIFSFNSPYGACKSCDGLGTEFYFSEELVVEDENLSLRQGAIAVWQGIQARMYQQVMQAFSDKYKISLDEPFKNLSQEAKNIIFYGTGEDEIEIKYDAFGLPYLDFDVVMTYKV